MHPVNFKCHKIHRNCLQDNQNKLISKLCNIVYIWGKHACNIVHVWVNRNKMIYECIGLVDNKYTKLRKIGEKVLLIFGLAHINLPLW